MCFLGSKRGKATTVESMITWVQYYLSPWVIAGSARIENVLFHTRPLNMTNWLWNIIDWRLLIYCSIYYSISHLTTFDRVSYSSSLYPLSCLVSLSFSRLSFSRKTLVSSRHTTHTHKNDETRCGYNDNSLYMPIPIHRELKFRPANLGFRILNYHVTFCIAHLHYDNALQSLPGPVVKTQYGINCPVDYHEDLLPFDRHLRVSRNQRRAKGHWWYWIAEK
jgi:hypothetical protein